MMNDEEMKAKIESVCENYHGQFPDLFQMIGIVVVGRLFGWRVVRLVVSLRMWRLLNKWFGDPKQWMDPDGPLAYKSVGLKIVDQIGDYWGVIRGERSREDLPNHDRKMAV
jgi:hypothetical protein